MNETYSNLDSPLYAFLSLASIPWKNALIFAHFFHARVHIPFLMFSFPCIQSCTRIAFPYKK